MFGWGVDLGPIIPAIDVEKPRWPPALPTPLDFPSYNFINVPGDDYDARFTELYRLLLSLRKPQDISADHVTMLNLKVESEVPISSIVPEECLESLPQLPWENAAAANSHEAPESSLKLGNGRPYPSQDKFELTRSELLFDNEDAFREISRLKPLPGRQRIKVKQARKFWVGLARMSEYWDTSLDNYFQQPSKLKESTDDQESNLASDSQSSKEGSGDFKSGLDIDSKNSKSETLEDSGKEEMYTGRRIGAGHEMPEDIREETLRGLIETVAWPFACQVMVPLLPPRLAVRNLLLPVRQSFLAARSPQDRNVARKGVLEGPVFVVQCRAETCFREPDEAIGCGQKEMCDIFREVGALLLTAQERSREGQTEVRPGEGKWWTTAPRWGGAPDKGVTGDGGDSDSKPEAEVGNAFKRSKLEHPVLSSRKPIHPRKLSTAEKWKILQPGPSLWDKRMQYMQIGKPKESCFDDIYMASSINHHVSIVHLRIHRRYLDHLTSGKSDLPSESTDSDQPWHVLRLRRTKWLDLFKASDRLDAFEGVWRVFHYLTTAEPTPVLSRA